MLVPGFTFNLTDWANNYHYLLPSGISWTKFLSVINLLFVIVTNKFDICGKKWGYFPTIGSSIVGEKLTSFFQMGLRPDLEFGLVVQPLAGSLLDCHPVLGHRNVGHPPDPVQVWRPQGQTSGGAPHRLASHSDVQWTQQHCVIISCALLLL